MSHRCHARGCEEETPPRNLFCLTHWRMTPKPLQDAVWKNYRPGQERTKDPSVAYLRAMDEAIEAVAAIEAERAR